jgi:hypothetical protein
MPSQKLRTVDLTMSDSVSVSTSPWTGARQTYDWMADHWSAEVSLPPLTTAQVGAWTAWFGLLRGQVGYFWLGHPLFATPFGSNLGAPLVSGPAQTGRVLATRGWTASKTGLLLPGDYIQIGVRLHMVLSSINSDVSGYASIPIWPQIRESQADGAPINTTNAQGLFALATNDRKFTSSEVKTWGITLNAVEAI